MGDDNTQGAVKPSPASAGSHGEPFAWAVHYGLDPDPEVHFLFPRHAAESGRAIVPLYRQPTLTDAERTLVYRLAEEREDGHPRAWTNRALTSDDRATLRWLLERTK